MERHSQQFPMEKAASPPWDQSWPQSPDLLLTILPYGASSEEKVP